MLRGSCWQATSLVPTLPGSALHHTRSQGCPPGLGGWSFQKPLEPGSREEMAPPPKLLPDPTMGQSCAQPAGLQARAGRLQAGEWPQTPTPLWLLQCRVLMMAPASSIIFRIVPPWTLPATLASSGPMILGRGERSGR